MIPLLREFSRKVLARSWRYNSSIARGLQSWGSVSPSSYDVCNAQSVSQSVARWYKLIPVDANGDQSDSENARLQ